MATETLQTVTIYKKLTLRVDIEAPNAREAFDRMLEMDDSTFEVVGCGYEVYDEAGDEISVEEYE